MCDEETQKKCIIETAAELIKSDIKALPTTRALYPNKDDIASLSANLNFVPDSLQLLLKTIFSGKDTDLKVASTGQVIMQAARPRVLICPLQIGLAVQMHHCFNSKFLVDTLYSLGFSVSYSEVMTYEMNAAVSDHNVASAPEGHFIQYMADNVDHNTATLDGFNTFHGMGIIASVTPRVNSTVQVRRQTDVRTEEIINKAKIDIKYYRDECLGLMTMKFESLTNTFVKDPTSEVDLLWKACWLLHPHRPSWSGVMQAVHHGSFPGQSSVIFMPMIDMNPSDKTCIYSTLCFICAEVKRNKSTPVLTFDQPLWWKALSIISGEPADSDLQSIVLRLGPFHLEMSFLACIGHLMEETGLHEVLSTVYASNSVSAMLQGKAVQRAVRGHVLLDAALNALLMSDTFGVPLPHPKCQTETDQQSTLLQVSTDVLPASPTSVEHDSQGTVCEKEETLHAQLSSGTTENIQDEADLSQNEAQRNDLELNAETELKPVRTSDVPQDMDTAISSALNELQDKEDLQTASALHSQLLKGAVTPDSVKNNDCLNRIASKLNNKKLSLSGRTCDLWLQYMAMVDILKRFLKAERTGNWLLHLSVVREMLPYLAAAGHNSYTKSAYLYLQTMNKLDKVNPVVYKSFVEGHHVVRRSNRYWAGISSDLTIEQTLMRGLKTTGGLTRGRGMTESQRAKWVLSMPACADVNTAMQEVTDTSRLTSDQHIEMGSSRMAKDTDDMMTITSYLCERNPFANDPSLRNIDNGVVADSSVNVDQAKAVGLGILNGMEGLAVADLTMKQA